MVLPHLLKVAVIIGILLRYQIAGNDLAFGFACTAGMQKPMSLVHGKSSDQDRRVQRCGPQGSRPDGRDGVWASVKACNEDAL